MAFTTGGPIVMFGTNIPSMTSTWSQSAPAASTAAISSPSLAKSAERIDGATRTGDVIGAPSLAVLRALGKSDCRGLPQLLALPLRQLSHALRFARACESLCGNGDAQDHEGGLRPDCRGHRPVVGRSHQHLRASHLLLGARGQRA